VNERMKSEKHTLISLLANLCESRGEIPVKGGRFVTP